MCSSSHIKAPVVRTFIDGASVAPSSDAHIDVVNPSNGRSLFELAAGTAGEADLAVASARRCFEAGHWRDMTPAEKRNRLDRFADLIVANADRLDALDAEEMGKPVSETQFGAADAAGLMRYYSEVLDKGGGELFDSARGSVVFQRWMPRGVVAAITPWNFPTYNVVLKLAPALAAGNSVVLKPSELSSRSAMLLANLALDADLPPGLFNIVPGLGTTVGEALALHHDVDLIAFTGSTATGKRMMQYSGASNMKAVLAECGGKSPHILFDDGVNHRQACAAIARGFVTNQGQICSAGTRLLVARSIEQDVVGHLLDHIRNLRIGDALDPQVNFGPVASARQLERVVAHLDAARADGIEPVTGGVRVLEETGGYFVAPTLYRNVPPTAAIAQEEVFGPVLTVHAFDSEAEATAIANGTIYGLMAYIWTADLSRAMRLSRDIRSSQIINAAMPSGPGAGHGASFEPAGQSGLGVEGGIAGLRSYQRRQLSWINHA